MSKSNRSLKNREDEAVSPVIGTILMVAITVVLAASVYAWVSAFGNHAQAPSRSVSLSSNAPIASDGTKVYTISAASGGMSWQQLKVTINGAEMTLAATADATHYAVAHGATAETGTDSVDAGDMLTIHAASGQTLRLIDAQSNGVVLTMVIG